MCINGELLSVFDVMNGRWDYRGRRPMSVMKMVDGSGRLMKMVNGVVSMGMMSVVEMVISCHSFPACRVLLLLFLASVSF